MFEEAGDRRTEGRAVDEERVVSLVGVEGLERDPCAEASQVRGDLGLKVEREQQVGPDTEDEC